MSMTFYKIKINVKHVHPVQDNKQVNKIHTTRHVVYVVVFDFVEDEMRIANYTVDYYFVGSRERQESNTAGFQAFAFGFFRLGSNKGNA